MKVKSYGNFGFGQNEEPKFNQQLFRLGFAALSNKNLRGRRVICQVGKFFSGGKGKVPKVVHSRRLPEKIRTGLKSMNEWAPAGGLAFALIGAIVYDQCRATQMASDLKNVGKLLDKIDQRFEKFETRFDKLETKIDKIERRFDKLETKFDKLESIFERLDAKL